MKTSPTLSLESAAARFVLSTRAGLRAVSWENRLNDTRLTLGSGAEFELDFDAAERRLHIEGWRVKPTDLPGPAPDAESGFQAGFHLPGCDDAAWATAMTPSLAWWLEPQEFYWARTHLFLPAEIADRPLTLVLGGFGLWDFRRMRVFVNGTPVGVREPQGRWFAPGRFDLSVGTAAHKGLRFGHDNVIALQLADPIRRTAHLDELDPHAAHSLPYTWANAPQFEQYLVVGRDRTTPRFVVVGSRRCGRSRTTACRVRLKATNMPLAAQVTYAWEDDGRTLNKTVRVGNKGKTTLQLLEARLGDYRTDGVTSDGEQGFPVYINHDRFAAIAHPAGWATGGAGALRLRHYPGCLLRPGECWTSLPAVLVVAPAGEARPAFVQHIRRRMRRVRRGRERAFAIFEPFGAKPDGSFWETEEFLLDNINRLAADYRATGCRFDYYSVDFWTHSKGDLTAPAPDRFPHGFDRIRKALRPLRTDIGLWCDSTMGDWNMGDNPVVAACRVSNPGYPQTVIGHPLCRATDPFRSLFTNGFCHQVRNNGARLLKFDNLFAICHNLTHSHLPGIFSTEAIHSAAIATFQALDAVSPEVMIMLYWGYRSPWWLLYGDTLFEPGIMMEAATPAATPTLYARDGVTVCLDQAQAWADQIPALGKDSLGVWLSSWPWNSSIGKERWAESLVMDICRGSLLVQPWSDTGWLTPAERAQFAALLALVRERPACFGRPQPVLASPWSGRPYGYSCGDGRRGFLALNNCTWADAPIDLALTAAWGLQDGLEYRLVRHFPAPAELHAAKGSFRRHARLWLRPFEVVLIEAVPVGEEPSGLTEPTAVPLPSRFVTASRELSLRVRRLPAASGPRTLAEEEEKRDGKAAPADAVRRVFAVSGTLPVTDTGGVLAVTAELRRDGRALPTGNLGSFFAAAGRRQGRVCPLQPVLGAKTYPASWQAWRLEVPRGRAQTFRLEVVLRFPGSVDLQWKAHFIPVAERPGRGAAIKSKGRQYDRNTRPETHRI